MDALDRAMELMQIPIKDLPKKAIAIRDMLSREVGLCMEVCITAFAWYAQAAEGLTCNDIAYRIDSKYAQRVKDICNDATSSN